MSSTEADPRRPSLDFLIGAAKSSDLDDTPAMNEIIRRFEALARKLAWSTTGVQHLHDDLVNAARSALVTAVRRHDPKEPTFPAYAAIYMRGAVRREYRRWLSPEADNSDHEIRPTEPEVEPVDPEILEEAVIDRLAPWGDGGVGMLVDELTPEQRRIAHLRYVEDAQLADIAAETGTTSSAVSQRLRTIHCRIEGALPA